MKSYYQGRLLQQQGKIKEAYEKYEVEAVCIVNRKKHPDGGYYKDYFYYACKHRKLVDGHRPWWRGFRAFSTVVTATESSLIRLWNAVPQPVFFPMSASQFRHQSRHRLHECGNRKHRLCRIVLQRGGPYHLLLLSLGDRAWWKCRALNKMMEDHPQKRRPRAGAFVTNHQHALQLHAWFFHQFWRSPHLF